jgi:hypothetical protein
MSEKRCPCITSRSASQEFINPSRKDGCLTLWNLEINDHYSISCPSAENKDEVPHFKLYLKYYVSIEHKSSFWGKHLSPMKLKRYIRMSMHEANRNLTNLHLTSYSHISSGRFSAASNSCHKKVEREQQSWPFRFTDWTRDFYEDFNAICHKNSSMPSPFILRCMHRVENQLCIC